MSQYPSTDIRTQALISLGNRFRNLVSWYRGIQPDNPLSKELTAAESLLIRASQVNPWFTLPNQISAFSAWSTALSEDAVIEWMKKYEGQTNRTHAHTIAVIMAGNIPLVGMHDLICTIAAGKNFLGKLSKDDQVLLPAIMEELFVEYPQLRPHIRFSTEPLRDFDAVIATGSNNTARYFEYYFSSKPHIIRRNRNGVAVIHGRESRDSLKNLGRDITQYFGLGCRNVSKIFLPAGYNPAELFTGLNHYGDELFDHFKYMNNYHYQKTLLLMNQVPFYDNGTSLLTESTQYSSPVSVIHFEFWSEPEQLRQRLSDDRESIQCIVSELQVNSETILPGYAQLPGLSDYADGVDTMSFLLNLH